MGAVVSEVAPILDRIMQLRGTDKVGLSRVVGVSEATIHNWYAGTTTPTAAKMAAIRGALDSAERDHRRADRTAEDKIKRIAGLLQLLDAEDLDRVHDYVNIKAMAVLQGEYGTQRVPEMVAEAEPQHRNRIAQHTETTTKKSGDL